MANSVSESGEQRGESAEGFSTASLLPPYTAVGSPDSNHKTSAESVIEAANLAANLVKNQYEIQDGFRDLGLIKNQLVYGHNLVAWDEQEFMATWVLALRKGIHGDMGSSPSTLASLSNNKSIITLNSMLNNGIEWLIS
ncbi:hypothetical protein LXL04_023185 [Taraxacum kok-saghyz]